MFCDKAKEYLSQKGAQFQERDIMQDPVASDECQEARLHDTPVIVIDGTVIVGFDTGKIDAVLKVASSSS